MAAGPAQSEGPSSPLSATTVAARAALGNAAKASPAAGGNAAARGDAAAVSGPALVATAVCGPSGAALGGSASVVGGRSHTSQALYSQTSAIEEWLAGCGDESLSVDQVLALDCA